MALSVIQIGYGPNSHGMYDSRQKKIIMTGEKEELFNIKHILEEMEQQKSNADHMKMLRKKYVKIVLSSGITKEEANKFLEERIPEMYK